MSTEIYNFDYEKESQKESKDFVPLGSTNPKTNIRSSPIVVPSAAVKSAARVSSKRAETPATTTTRKAMPVIFRQKPYDYELNRPFSPIQVNPDEDGNFFGGKKRSRKTRSTRRKRSRSMRRKQTKRSSSRRRRGRKAR